MTRSCRTIRVRNAMAGIAGVQPGNPATKIAAHVTTSTISGQKLGIVEEIRIASKSGYNAIEPWIGEIDTYVRTGGTLQDLKKQIADAGLAVESVIGFFEWIVDDDARRAKGMEEARRN